MRVFLKNLEMILKAFVSNEALTSLYQQRQLGYRPPGRRPKATLAVVSLLLTLIMLFLILIGWQRNNIEAYLGSHKRIVVPAATDLHWLVSDVISSDCATERECRHDILTRGGEFKPVSLESFIPRLKNPAPEVKSALVALRVVINRDEWTKLLEIQNRLVVSFPNFSYDVVDVYFNGSHVARFLDDNRMAGRFDDKSLNADLLTADLVFRVASDQTEFLQKAYKEPLFVTTLKEYTAYYRTLMMEEAMHGGWISDLARIVMAAFVLMLFLLVDSSAEVLGLALVLGLDGLSLSLSYGWLPISNRGFLVAYCDHMADIFRLYYFLQLARLSKRGLMPWFVTGSILVAPYALLFHYRNTLDIDLDRVLDWSNLVVGCIGFLICSRAAGYLMGKGLPWRVWALGTAAAASLFFAFIPAISFFPVVNNSAWYAGLIDILVPAGAYLFAMSAFINISTLENRVVQLSASEAKSKIIEKELELGRTVQRAFMKVPELPSVFDLACHYEAAMYVSGDSYFVNWDESKDRLAVLVNDVTGHGVQAALKSSACQVIAKTLWSSSLAQDETPGSHLVMFEKLLRGFFSDLNDEPDIPAILGFEFERKMGLMRMYRMNFSFPYVIIPERARSVGNSAVGAFSWGVHAVPIQNGKLTTMTMKPGAFFVILSDGFFSDSRGAHEFVQRLRQELDRYDERLAASDVRRIIVDLYAMKKSALPEDDKTLMVFHWQPQAEQQRECA